MKDSREADAYRVARKKLDLITRTLTTDQARSEMVFSRVMSLVPPDELQDILLNAPSSPLSTGDEERIAAFFQAGFKRWNDFHQEYGRRQQAIRQQSAGLVTWDDVIGFATRHANAKSVDGFVSQTFGESGGSTRPVATLRVEGEPGFFYGDFEGTPVYGPNGEIAKRLGLNICSLADALRKTAFPKEQTGAAYVRWSGPLPPGVADLPFGVLVIVRQTVRPDIAQIWSEHGISLHCFVVARNSSPIEVSGALKAGIIRGLLAAPPRRQPADSPELVEALHGHEGELSRLLWQPNKSESLSKLRHAVLPILAAIAS